MRLWPRVTSDQFGLTLGKLMIEPIFCIWHCGEVQKEEKIYLGMALIDLEKNVWWLMSSKRSIVEDFKIINNVKEQIKNKWQYILL